jgi:transcriptional regulator with XRE-family HTH domain
VDPLSVVRESAFVASSREQFAANLRRQRDKSGLSQEALADVCDLHRTEISLLERSKRSPRLETIVILAKGLGLSSPGELLDGIS